VRFLRPARRAQTRHCCSKSRVVALSNAEWGQVLVAIRPCLQVIVGTFE
jgi:hypothetical protein